MKSISIIGAGAAGLMAAATILEHTGLCHTDGGSICPKEKQDNKQIPRTSEGQNVEDFHIHIYEKNKTPGNKIVISGGGRCNVTTSITDKKMLASKYTRGWEFIRKAMGKFSPAKTYEWFESHGVPLKTQADMRVFPVSDDGYDVVAVYERLFAKYRDRVTLHYGEGVTGVSLLSFPRFALDRLGDTKDLLQNNIDTDSSFAPQSGLSSCSARIHLLGITKEQSTGLLRPSQGQEENKQYTITTAKGVYTTDILLITTGGNAYSHTGSTGDGYAFARALGHTVTQLGPSLSSWLTRESHLHALSGLAFEDARITSYTTPHMNRSGPLLLTHFGISGPLAFILASDLAWETIDKSHPRTISLAPRADMIWQDWDIFLKTEFQSHPKKVITTILSEKLPRRFVEVFVAEYCREIGEKYVSTVSAKDREKVSKLLGEGLPITLIERRPGDEFVTAGGISTDELHADTMESKLEKNLYFAGEVLNVDGYTGGFSLQICWSSGYVAGRDIASKI